MSRRHLKIGVISLAILVVLIMMVWAWAYIGSMRAWKQGEKLFQEGRYIKAVTFFDHSIHWYTPWNPYVERSVRSLWEIGARAEKKGDDVLALMAYRTIRRGFYGIQGIYAPGKSWIERSTAKINALLVKETGKGEPRQQEGIQPAPSSFWSLLLELGLLGWLGTMVVLIVKGFRNNRGAKAPALSLAAWGVLSVAFFVLWVIGMIKA